MTSMDYKKDRFFAWLGILSLLSVVPMFFAGVWVDDRWWGSGWLALALGIASIVVSLALDDRYEKKGVRK